jgi:hypothetical protein
LNLKFSQSHSNIIKASQIKSQILSKFSHIQSKFKLNLKKTFGDGRLGAEAQRSAWWPLGRANDGEVSAGRVVLGPGRRWGGHRVGSKGGGRLKKF